MQHTYSINENISANSGEQDVETWSGVEIASAPDYNALTHVITGGFFSRSGPGAGTITVLDDTGVKMEAFEQGDPGYHVHYVHPAGSPGFVLSLSVEYDIVEV